MSYESDITEAAKSGAAFDEVNAEEIGDLHGEDPTCVLHDIKKARIALKGESK